MPIRRSFMVSYITTLSVTSCIRSLSEETMVVVAPRSLAEPRIGRDQIVGLEAGLFQAGQVERAHRLADQRELRDQVVRRRRPVRLVVGIELVAERDFGLVEDDGQMRRPVILGHVAQQLPQHVAEAEHGIDLQPVGLAVQAAAARDRRGKCRRNRRPGTHGRPCLECLRFSLGSLAFSLGGALEATGFAAALGADFGMAEI